MSSAKCRFPYMIESLLDTDLYKFNMLQVIFHKHTDLWGRYYFKDRKKTKYTPEMVEEIKAQVDHLCTLSFKKKELDYLRTIPYLKRDFIELLSFWHPVRKYVRIQLTKNNHLSIVVKGPVFAAMMFEIYLLEIVNETYFRMSQDYTELRRSAEERLNKKITAMNDGTYTFPFAEFGCRRRLSREWQEEVVRRFATETRNCIGTSNVYLAMKYHLTPIGTYAHEYVQMFQGIPTIPLAYTNAVAMQEWFEEYKGDNGIALTDTIGTPTFLRDFTLSHMNNYKGVRHDSGSPDKWAEMIIAHYKKNRIDPRTKTLLFSDGLNFDEAQRIYNKFKDQARVSFGIGTFCSNDTCAEPLNIVIKLQYIEQNGVWRPVAKLSDNSGKAMCRDSEYLAYLQKAVDFRLREQPEN